jgi:hypothetical protein
MTQLAGSASDASATADTMSGALQIGASVGTSWALAGLAVAAILLMVVLRPDAALRYPLIAVAAICLIAIAIERITPLLGRSEHAIALRVTVLGPDGSPVAESKVRSSIGGEPKKVEGGWEFTIPAERRGDKLTIFAESLESKGKGRQDLNLGQGLDQTVSVTLVNPPDATLRGTIVDNRGSALAGARVWVSGYGPEAVTTDVTGTFVLAAHAAAGDRVEIQAEAPNRHPWSQQAMADDQSLRIMLAGK